jgi:hypothetical protein
MSERAKGRWGDGAMGRMSERAKGRKGERAKGRWGDGKQGAKRFVPKGLKDSAWGFNPRYRSKKDAHPEGVADGRPALQSI